MPSPSSSDYSDISPLSEPRFLETHVQFETASDQQAQIRDTLRASPLPSRASVLSIGPGSGILDAPLLADLVPSRRLRYVGVEPNAVQSQDLSEKLSDLDLDAEVITSTFEDYSGRETFDAVWVIHTHYYFSDVPKGLERAWAHVGPGGRMTLAAAPRGALNKLSQVFWQDHADDDLWFADEVKAFLLERELSPTQKTIEGRLDVTPCFEGTSQGDAIRDFVAQAEVSGHPTARDRVDQALREMGQEDADGRWTVPHPVEVFEVTAPS